MAGRKKVNMRKGKRERIALRLDTEKKEAGTEKRDSPGVTTILGKTIPKEG